MPPLSHVEPAGATPAARGRLHPIAWWVWALGLATAASHTTNPLLLLLVLGVLGFVVASRRSERPGPAPSSTTSTWPSPSWPSGSSSGPSSAVTSDTDGMHVLFRLPHIPLPSWAAGVQLGGPVTLEGTLSALYDGLRLGTLLCCLGAANTLANPKRALRSCPAPSTSWAWPWWSP